MRNYELFCSTDSAVCPQTASQGSAVKRTNSPASPSMKDFLCRAHNAELDEDGRIPGSREKPVIAPAVFVFQKLTPSKKRWPEDCEDRIDLGHSACKRKRSLTFPSLRLKCRTGCERRARTSSISFPTLVSGFPPVQRGALLRPAILPAPQPWSRSSQPHLTEMRPPLAQRGPGPTDRVTAEMGQENPIRSVPLMPHGPRIPFDRSPFVFGESMSDRVLSPSKSSEDCSISSLDCSDPELSDVKAQYQMSGEHTLLESAAAYTTACRRHCLLKRVQIFTGEEQESNVVQLSCKLFVLEKRTQSWSERGGGILRLNDMAMGPRGQLQSRLVMRQQGTLKLILNSWLWPHTHLRRPSRRSLQVMATDLESHDLQVFLVQASARDAARLYVAIHHRLVALRSQSSDMEDEDREDVTRPWQAEEEEEEEVTQV